VNERVYHSITAFNGLYRRSYVPDGGFAALRNVSTGAYPLLQSMDGDAEYDFGETPLGITVRHLPYNGELREHLLALTATELYTAPAGGGPENGTWQDLSATLSNSPKQLANMGHKLVIFPDAVYLDMEDPATVVSLNASFSTELSLEVAACNEHGELVATAASTQPSSPVAGSRYVNTTDVGTTVYEWDAAALQWVAVQPYVRIKRTRLGKPFKVGDVVEISGLYHSAEYAIYSGVTGDTFYAQLEALNGSHEIIAKGDDWIVITGLLLANARRPSAGGSVFMIRRAAPDMDYVCECGNRLWGCKYGVVNGELVNELYASALGDPTNWRRYAGLADDSWAASVGADGPWTGCVSYNGNPYFFRENAVYKVYISSAGAHQVVETVLPGVGAGCADSIAVLKGQLYYARRDGVYRFDGGIPERISTALGEMTIGSAAAGTDGQAYRLCVHGSAPEELVYHTESGCWGRGEEVRRTQYVYFDHVLYGYDSGSLYARDPARYTFDARYGNWYAESGWYYGGMNTKSSVQKPLLQAITEFRVLALLKPGATLTLSLERDGDHVFYAVKTFTETDTNAEGRLRDIRFPVPPERCGVFRYRLSGHGPCTVYRVTMIETESDG